jgi:hypothetical protein
VITFISTKTLTALRDQVTDLTAQLEETESELEVTGLEATRLAAELDAAIREAAGHLTFLLEAAADPQAGTGVQGAIALAVVRNQIDQAHASGDTRLIEAFRPLDAILGNGLPDTRPAAPLSTEPLRDGANHQTAPAGANR